VAQTARLAKWVIVSDGSTDGTDEIVGRYAAEHRWIELVRTPGRRERDFAGKVRAFDAASPGWGTANMKSSVISMPMFRLGRATSIILLAKSSSKAAIKARFRTGTKDYLVGNHPAWQLFRMLYQMTQRPFLVGGRGLASGYIWSWVRNVKRPVSNDLVAFIRHEQIQRLAKCLTASSRFVLSGHLKEQQPVRGGSVPFNVEAT